MNASAKPVVAVDDLTVELGGLPVLRGITFQVGAGETVALLGGNGSGKSTLVRALVGLLPFQRGSVDVFGTPLPRFRGWRRLGYVPQRTPIGTSAATVAEVVAAGRLAHRLPFVPAGPGLRREVMAALAIVDLVDRARDPISWLSGGQQQRVLIARALVAQPELLILDEPIAGVDLAHQQVLAGVLDSLTARGAAMVIVLHEIGPLASQIDRVIMLREGRISYQGSLSGLGDGPAIGGHDCGEPPTTPATINADMISTDMINSSMINTDMINTSMINTGLRGNSTSPKSGLGEGERR